MSSPKITQFSGVFVTAGETKWDGSENCFSRRRHIPSPASAPRPMPCAKRPAADLHHHVRVARYRSCDVRARQPPPATVGGARSRTRELCYISSCKGNGHASFSCSRHSVPYGECRERIGSHNSYPLRRRCQIAFDASCRRWKWAHASRYDMMVTVSTGCIRLVVESYGSLVGGGTLFGRVLGYFLC